MADQEKRIHELVETGDKSGKYIALDAPGLPEALKYPVDSFVTTSQTDLLYVKLSGNETVNGVKTWANNGIFQAGINITGGNLAIAAGNLNISGNIVQTGSATSLEINPYQALNIGQGTNNANFALSVFKGNGTATIEHHLKGSGNSYLCLAGDLGIGFDSTPAAKVHILTASQEALRLQDSSGSAILSFQNSAYEFALSLSTAGTFKITNITGASDLITVLNSGFVGLGIPTPNNKLAISDITEKTIRISHSGVGAWDLGIANSDSFSIWDQNITNAYFTIANSGFIGIGETSPDTILHVSSIDPVVKLESLQTYDNTPFVEISGYFEYNSANLKTFFGGIVISKENGTDGDTGGFISFYKKPKGIPRSEGMRFDPDGNLGIGTTAPGYKLHVSDSLNDYLACIQNTNTGSSARGLFINISAQANGIYISTGYATGAFSVGYYLNSALAYLRTTTSSSNLYINSSGNILRSTSSIKAKENIKYKLDPNLALNLKPCEYKEKSTKIARFGLIAEQVNKIDERFANNQKEPGFMGLETNAIIAAMLATIQKQEKRINQLEKK